MKTEDLVNKLEELYKKEEKLIGLIKELQFKLDLLQDDKEMLKTSIKFLAIKDIKNDAGKR